MYSLSALDLDHQLKEHAAIWQRINFRHKVPDFPGAGGGGGVGWERSFLFPNVNDFRNCAGILE
jgi:hypothetical protein